MPAPGKSYSYSQNHCFIPVAGLAVAAYALWDEAPEAASWAALSRAIFSRVLDISSPDGYFYEGVEYWMFSMPWIIHALDAFAHAAGDDMYDTPALRKAHLYMAHSLTPNGQDVYDFGDVFEGPITRAHATGEEPARTHPGGKLNSNYNLVYRLAARFRNPDAQGVADWMASLGHVCAEDFWTLLWRDPALTAEPMARIAPHHHFEDLGTVYWRSDWTPKATAFAFRAGPPEGHHVAAILMTRLPDWHLEMGHSHPDAGSFILYGGGSYLTGPMGYAGIPSSKFSNTLLIDDKGQANEGGGHDAFRDYPYARLDSIRITSGKLDGKRAEIVAELTGAYRPELGVDKLQRRFSFTRRTWVVTDTLRASRPVVLTAQVHGDRAIVPAGDAASVVEGKPASLKVELSTAAAKAMIGPGIVSRQARRAMSTRDRPRNAAACCACPCRPASDATLVTKLSF
jgi:hypothetical protein